MALFLRSCSNCSSARQGICCSMTPLVIVPHFCWQLRVSQTNFQQNNQKTNLFGRFWGLRVNLDPDVLQFAGFKEASAAHVRMWSWISSFPRYSVGLARSSCTFSQRLFSYEKSLHLDVLKMCVYFSNSRRSRHF